MKRSTKRLLTAVIAAIVTGLAAWMVWLLWPTPLEKRLVGTWDGTGQLTGEWSLDVKPDLEQGVPGGKAAGEMTSPCTVVAEFRPDGTYIWREHQQGGGMRVNLWFPQEGAPPPRWEVVRSRGNRLTVRIHLGEVVFEFRGNDAFTMDWPESAKADGAISFRRPHPARK